MGAKAFGFHSVAPRCVRATRWGRCVDGKPLMSPPRSNCRSMLQGSTKPGAASAEAAVRQRFLLHRGRPREMDEAPRDGPRPRGSIPPDDPGQDRALAPDIEEPHPARKLISAGRSGRADRRLRRAVQSRPISRKPAEPHTRRRLLRTRPHNPHAQRKDQTPDHRLASLAASATSRVTSSTKRARASLNLHRSLSQKLRRRTCYQ